MKKLTATLILFYFIIICTGGSETKPAGCIKGLILEFDCETKWSHMEMRRVMTVLLAAGIQMAAFNDWWEYVFFITMAKLTWQQYRRRELTVPPLDDSATAKKDQLLYYRDIRNNFASF